MGKFHTAQQEGMGRSLHFKNALVTYIWGISWVLPKVPILITSVLRVSCFVAKMLNGLGPLSLAIDL